MPKLPEKDISNMVVQCRWFSMIRIVRAAKRGRGQLALGSQPQGAPNLRNKLKLSKAAS